MKLLKDNWAMVAVVVIFGMCGVIVLVEVVLERQTSKGLLELLILAGALIAFLDRQSKLKATESKIEDTAKKVDENTEITKSAKEEAKQAAKDAKLAQGDSISFINKAKEDIKEQMKKREKNQ